MKRIWIAMMAALVLAVFANVAQAVTSNLILGWDTTPSYLGEGGPFRASNIVNGPANLVVDGTGFTTFCIEENEYFFPGQSYNFFVADYAFMGGKGGQTSPNQDPLDEKSAYLYWRFRTDPGFATTTEQVQALQVAFWYIEDEITGFPTDNPGTLAVFDVALATAEVGKGWTNDGRVRVLNLYKGDDANTTSKDYNAGHYQAQSQLGLFSVPEPGTLLLLGSGFLPMGLVLRKRFGK